MTSLPTAGIALSVVVSLGALSVPTVRQHSPFARGSFSNRPVKLSSVPGLAEATAGIAAAVSARDKARFGQWMSDDVVINDEALSKAAYLDRLEASEWQHIAGRRPPAWNDGVAPATCGRLANRRHRVCR